MGFTVKMKNNRSIVRSLGFKKSIGNILLDGAMLEVPWDRNIVQCITNILIWITTSFLYSLPEKQFKHLTVRVSAQIPCGWTFLTVWLRYLFCYVLPLVMLFESHWTLWLEKEKATHSSILAWKIPWTGKPGGLCLWLRTESDTTEATLQQQQDSLVFLKPDTLLPQGLCSCCFLNLESSSPDI